MLPVILGIAFKQKGWCQELMDPSDCYYKGKDDIPAAGSLCLAVGAISQSPFFYTLHYLKIEYKYWLLWS